MILNQRKSLYKHKNWMNDEVWWWLRSKVFGVYGNNAGFVASRCSLAAQEPGIERGAFLPACKV